MMGCDRTTSRAPEATGPAAAAAELVPSGTEAAASRTNVVAVPPDSPQFKRLRIEPVRLRDMVTDEVIAPGRISVNPNRVSRVLPPVQGRVLEVHGTAGRPRRAWAAPPEPRQPRCRCGRLHLPPGGSDRAAGKVRPDQVRNGLPAREGSLRAPGGLGEGSLRRPERPDAGQGQRGDESRPQRAVAAEARAPGAQAGASSGSRPSYARRWPGGSSRSTSRQASTAARSLPQ